VNGKTLTVRDALNAALDEELERDYKVFLMGEEVGYYQGAYKITKGLIQKYGKDRVIDTPITEAGFCGIGVGASFVGTRPVIEFMTWNFAMQAMDSIINSAAKSRYMSGGNIAVPITFRGPNGPPGATAGQHSQCYAAWFSSIPGLKVIAPFNCNDAKGLLKSAIRAEDPVIFLESEIAYNYSFPLSAEAESPDYLLPIGKAHIERSGTDVTIVAFSRVLLDVLKAADTLAQEGINAEVINLRTLRPLDIETITNSIKKTSRLVTVEEGFPQCGIGAEIIALANEYAFDYLDAPPERITAADVPMPYSKAIEELAVPTAPNIVNAVRRVCYRKKK